MTLPDSGARREFETGAVRDISDGKGRFDLVPMDIVAAILQCALNETAIVGSESMMYDELRYIENFKRTGGTEHLLLALVAYAITVCGIYNPIESVARLLLRVAKRFEDGATKYGERNWEKGINAKHYMDSAGRHHAQWLAGDGSEDHIAAVGWNLLCAIWTCKHKPELNDYGGKQNDPQRISMYGIGGQNETI